MLRVEGVEASYDRVTVLFGVDLEARPGEIHCVMGRNGAGKTTLMRAIMGHVPLGAGRITLGDREISAMAAHDIPRAGLGYVPQGRRLFPEMTVAENIEMGLWANRSDRATRDWVLSLFPRLSERLSQQARTLSGGEQQMLTTARALCLRPSVLLLDEPTEGLQPSMIALIRDVTVQMKAEGLAVLLVEQRVDAVLEIADRVTFVEHGRSVETLAAADLRAAPEKIHAYLGV